ncbi:deoxynucleotidyltransferase terminal-interacting protein 2 isoform X1 [Vespa crabro]|uniref:deoxynucleotidyltransferase terminal-interacting protein 2 isoform X1 n=2 Tax=Vespa crabro TaxID=7445 RepID=UPI001EFFB296|nr:deoxynucleotidyltransferase terminal-interacting protein 2 isoform X1 [Vespa crabro]
MEIIIDTKGRTDLKNKNRLTKTDDNILSKLDNNEKGALWMSAKDFLQQAESNETKIKKFSHNDIDLDQFEKDMGWKNMRKQLPQNITNVTMLTKEIVPIDQILKKSAIKPGFERCENVPSFIESTRRLRVKKIAEREKTKGRDWFNLPATELTDEIKHDLEIIQMRSVLDPKHFYKKNDLKVLPKYFQIGKVVDAPIDYYSSRLTKKERKNTIVEELMADAEFAKYNKRKYKEIIEEKNKRHYKAHKHAKRLKGKKK